MRLALMMYPLSLALTVVACQSEADRHLAAITDACTSSGDDPAECSCVADSLGQMLDQDELAAMAGFFENLEAAESDEQRGMLSMGAMGNPVLVKGMQSAERLSRVCRRLVAASGSESSDRGRGGNRNLVGTYVPQLGDVPASERRLAAAAADRRWEFTEDGKVTTHSQGGARRWTYEIRGKEIRLTGAGPETRGERRLFTFHSDGRCIWDGRGNSSVDMRFCPQS